MGNAGHLVQSQLREAAAGNRRDAARGGCPVVTSGQDVRDLLQGSRMSALRRSPGRQPPAASASAMDAATSELADFFSRWPMSMEGEPHETVRQILVGGLRATFGAQQRDILSAQIGELVGNLPLNSDVDWISEVARPAADALLSAWLGIHGPALDRIRGLGETIMAEIHPQRPVTFTAKGREPVFCYPAETIAAVRGLHDMLDNLAANPASAFCASLDELRRDPRFGPHTAAGTLAQVITGTIEPLSAVLCAVAPFLESAAPGLPPFVFRNEVLRLSSPFRLLTRGALEDIVIGDLTIAANTRAVLHIGAANADERLFPDPSALLRREVPHLAFGVGRHYCPGATAVAAAIDSLYTALTSRGRHVVVNAMRCQSGDFLRFDELHVFLEQHSTT